MRYQAALLVPIALTALATSGFGHPPSAVTARFDTDEHLLTITVMHDVRDAAKHYIDQIEVEHNGKKIIEQRFKQQIDLNTQEALYRIIDARVGDKIKVTARCSISGKKSVEIPVEKKIEKKQGDAEVETGQ